MDSFDDFEFKPLTEGLGFHKKPDKINVGSGAARAAKASTSERTNERASERASARASQFEEELGAGAKPVLDSNSENELLGRDAVSAGRGSKSISDLIASLPPSLDFIDGKEERASTPMPSIEPNMNMPEGARPQIFQPFAREDFKAGAPKVSTMAAIAAPTVGSALAASGLGMSTGSASKSQAQTKSQTNPLSAQMPLPGSKAITPPAAAMAAGAAAKVPSAYRERLNESFARAFPHAERKDEGRGTAAGTARENAKRKSKATATSTSKTAEIAGLEPVSANLGAGVVDAMVVTGMSAILLVAIVGITHVNLYGLLTNVRTDGPTQVHLALLFLASLQLYLLTARSFFGASLGEWAFDLQLGSSEDQSRAVYPLQVAWRTIVVSVTGLVVLPLLSLVFRRDLASYASGLQLYFRKV